MGRPDRAPVRTCIGCRAQRTTASLVRVVAGADGSLLVSRSAPGRGAWLCQRLGKQVQGQQAPEPACAVLAQRKRAFSRALRREIAAPAVDALIATAGERGSMDKQASRPGA